MKSLTIGLSLFLFSFSASAGTFVEKFNKRKLENWQERVLTNEAPGSWEVVEGELHAVSPDNFTRLLTTGDETWQDYIIQFDVKPLEKHELGDIAIAARITGTELMYCTIGDRGLPGSNVTCQKGDFQLGESILIHTEPQPLLKMNEWSQLKLRVTEESFILWINGKKIAETGDDFLFVHDGKELMLETGGLLDFPLSLPTGGAGFGLTNYTARFDNIVITGEGIPDQEGLSVSSRGKLTTTWAQLKRF